MYTYGACMECWSLSKDALPLPICRTGVEDNNDQLAATAITFFKKCLRAHQTMQN